MARHRENTVQEKCVNEYGDGVSWIRGSMIGKGSYGRVYLATLKNTKSKYSCFPRVMAVKSSEVSLSTSIQKEREIMGSLIGCPNLIACFGDETTTGKNGVMAYNLLLEYASGGTLSDRIKKSGGNGLPESEIKAYTKSILKGLNHIHGLGYVHGDLKPDNILLVANDPRSADHEFKAKIGDFGLAKRVERSKKRKLGPYNWRGTPMYLSPEAVIDNVQEKPSDVWALGCVVLEMLTGKDPWRGRDVAEILDKIATENELPDIPSGMISKEAMDFLKGCFVRKAKKRLTSEMLLDHPFVEGVKDSDDDDDDDDDGEDEYYLSGDDKLIWRDFFPDESKALLDYFVCCSDEEDEDELIEETGCNFEEIERANTGQIYC